MSVSTAVSMDAASSAGDGGPRELFSLTLPVKVTDRRSQSAPTPGASAPTGDFRLRTVEKCNASGEKTYCIELSRAGHCDFLFRATLTTSSYGDMAKELQLSVSFHEFPPQMEKMAHEVVNAATNRTRTDVSIEATIYVEADGRERCRFEFVRVFVPQTVRLPLLLEAVKGDELIGYMAARHRTLEAAYHRKRQLERANTSEIAELRARIEQLEVSNESLRRQLADAKMQSEATEREVDDLRSEISLKQDELDQVRNDCETLDSMLADWLLAQKKWDAAEIEWAAERQRLESELATALNQVRQETERRERADDVAHLLTREIGNQDTRLKALAVANSLQYPRFKENQQRTTPGGEDETEKWQQ